MYIGVFIDCLCYKYVDDRILEMVPNAKAADACLQRNIKGMRQAISLNKDIC